MAETTQMKLTPVQVEALRAAERTGRAVARTWATLGALVSRGLITAGDRKITAAGRAALTALARARGEEV